MTVFGLGKQATEVVKTIQIAKLRRIVHIFSTDLTKANRIFLCQLGLKIDKIWTYDFYIVGLRGFSKFNTPFGAHDLIEIPTHNCRQFTL